MSCNSAGTAHEVPRVATGSHNGNPRIQNRDKQDKYAETARNHLRLGKYEELISRRCLDTSTEGCRSKAHALLRTGKLYGL